MFWKGRGTPDSGNYQNQGLRYCHDTFPATLSSASLFGSVVFSPICFLCEAGEICKTSGKFPVQRKTRFHDWWLLSAPGGWLERGAAHPEKGFLYSQQNRAPLKPVIAICYPLPPSPLLPYTSAGDLPLFLKALLSFTVCEGWLLGQHNSFLSVFPEHLESICTRKYSSS